MPTKISELTSATALDGTELIPVVQGGVTKQTTITDLVSGGELPAYSTTETLTTERWTDGKPIYMKTINHTFLGLGVVSLSSPISANIDNITKMDFVIENALGNYSGSEGLTSGTATTNHYVNYITSSYEIYARADSANWENNPITATVWYTKTTDTASSPVAGVTIAGGDSDWSTPTLTSAWAVKTGHDIRYRKDASGVVHIQGLVEEAGAYDSIVFTLPTGYRPVGSVIISAQTSLAAQNYNCILEITSTGEVHIGSGSEYISSPVSASSWVSLACSFYAG
jgi:hypothetical protein